MEVFSWGMAMRSLKSAWSPRKKIWRVRFDPSLFAPAEHSLREGIYLFFVRVSFFFPSFLLHLPLLSAFGCLLVFFFCFNFSASILFLCFSACLLFFFSASSASSASCCFFASLLLRFFRFFFFCFFCFFCFLLLLCFSVFSLFFFVLIFWFLLLLCFSACLLSFLCFSSSLGLSVLLWCLFYFYTFLCLMCHGKNMGYFSIKAICHEFIHRDLYDHDKDCHCEMDDHTLCIITMFWP